MSYGVIAYLAIAGDLVSDVKTKLPTAGCLADIVSSSLLQNSMADLIIVYEAAFSSYGVTLLTSRSMAVAGDLKFSIDKTIHS